MNTATSGKKKIDPKKHSKRLAEVILNDLDKVFEFTDYITLEWGKSIQIPDKKKSEEFGDLWHDMIGSLVAVQCSLQLAKRGRAFR